MLRDSIVERGRLFSVSLGVLVSVFVVTVYRDDIVWTQIGALSFTLLTIWTFLRSKHQLFIQQSGEVYLWYCGSSLFQHIQFNAVRS